MGVYVLGKGVRVRVRVRAGLQTMTHAETDPVVAAPAA